MSGPVAETDDRRYLLEKVGDAAVVQCYCDAWVRLTPRDRLLAYHLSRAAIAGRRIFVAQKCEHGAELLDLLEELYLHRVAMPPAVADAISVYTKRFWINNGPYHAITARKELLPLDPCSWRAAVDSALASGARLPIRSGESVDQLLARHDRMLFDASYRSMVTAKNPDDGTDILEASACTFYGPGVTMSKLADVTERFPLNSDVELDDAGRITEVVWRMGDPATGVPPGRHATEITEIVGHLESALPLAATKTGRALEALIRFYRTGAEADRIAYDIAWVEDTDPIVDTVNGFIEVYVDPRGRKGSWEGIVSIEDPLKAQRLKSIAEAASWFEAHMPYDPKFRKPDVKGISARSIDVIIETGDSGPVTPIGINLPNDQSVREEYGSKSVSLANISEAYERSAVKGARREWCLTDDEFERSEKFGRLANELHTDLHEIIGHGSGRQAEDRQGDPARWLREHASAIEEARADLIALYFLCDKKLEELGICDDAEAVGRAGFEAYARNGGLVQLRRVKYGDRLEEDHMRNRQMIVRWICANSQALASVVREGKNFLTVEDSGAFRRAVGELLREVQRIKSEGDYEGARALMETYGVKFDPSLRDEIVARYERHDSTTYTGFVYPRLEAVHDVAGVLVDAKMTFPLSLEDQMLEWSGRRAPPRSS